MTVQGWCSTAELGLETGAGCPGQRRDSAGSSGVPRARPGHKNSCAGTVHQLFLKLGHSQIPIVRPGDSDIKAVSGTVQTF